MNKLTLFSVMKIVKYSLYDLLKLTGENNPAAYHELYQRYKQTVYIMVKRRVPDEEEAKDITQEIFIHLWNNRNQLSQMRNFDTWLYAIIRNKVISAYRKNAVRLQGEQFLIDSIEQMDWNAEDFAIAKELNDKIETILSALPETTRNCYHLSKNEGKKNHEIAGILNLSEKTVRNNLSEALKRLKASLKEYYPELLTIIVLLNDRP